jgi:hypothetical protein
MAAAAANNMLYAASLVVGNILQLRAMVIWNGGRQHACVFGYHRTEEWTKISWHGTWSSCLKLHVVEAWKRATRGQT